MLESDDAFHELHAAGWSLGEVGWQTPNGPRWRVVASRDGVSVRGEGASQGEAWQACLEASRNAKTRGG